MSNKPPRGADVTGRKVKHTLNGKSLERWFSSFRAYQNLPECLLKHCVLLSASDSLGLVWGLMTCISYKLADSVALDMIL